MNCDTCGKPFRGRELIEHNAGKLVHRKCRRAATKRERVTQTSTVRRKRKAIDVDAVFARDAGVCALCGFDTTRVRPWLEALPSAWQVASPMLLRTSFGEPAYGRRDAHTERTGNGQRLGRHRDRALVLLGRLWKVVLSHGAHFSEIDHCKPIAEGGDDSLGNLRTLCRKCHVEVSAELMARLARRPTKAVGRGF
jgi:5-methylcytosine-specific restriction endonuclease McrA